MRNNLLQLRYEKNKNLITCENQDKLFNSRVSIVGLGGLGCYIAEQCARLGLGQIRLIDGDSFDTTNLNRQLYCSEETVNEAKVFVAHKRIAQINSDVDVKTFDFRLNDENADKLLSGCDLVFGAVDNIETRLILERSCEMLDLTLIDGAIGGWFGQVTISRPGERTLSKIYAQKCIGEEEEFGNPAFTCAVVASIQVAEGIKYFLNEQNAGSNILTIDLLNHRYERFEI